MKAIEVNSEITGAVWKIIANQGDTVAENDVLMIMESMKMEIPVLAPAGGVVTEIRVKENDPVAAGQVLAVLGT